MSEQNDEVGAVSVPMPLRNLDPFIGLSTAVHAGKGVYALLLGSGVSTAASIPTGWAIVTDLVRRAAAAADPALDVPVDGFDPDAWWADHGDGTPLGYSSLLNSLAPTAAGRDQILRSYFEATEEDRDEGRKLPTAAHEAIAELVTRGFVRVILTTNFDRLLERALEQRGIQPQVVHRSDQIAFMTPLAHRDVTIIKLHGDYADLDKRNTVDELATYPPEQDALLTRILDEYGLIVSGWSGEWDLALVRSLEEIKSRRYPMFWSSFSEPSESARRLIAQNSALLISNIGSDSLFTGLVDRLNALDRIGAAPLARDIAVERLKRFLPRSARRIELHDLLIDELKRLESLFSDRDRYPMTVPDGISNDDFWESYDGYLRQYRSDLDTMLHLLAAGVYFGDSEQNSLWTKVIQRLLGASGPTPTRFNQRLSNLGQYPGVLAMMTILGVSRLAERQDLLADVMIKPVFRVPQSNQAESAVTVAHPWRVFVQKEPNILPRWSAQKWQFPEGHLIRADLDEVLAVYEPVEARRLAAFDEAEYLLGLAQIAVRSVPFVGEGASRHRHRDEPWEISTSLRAEVETHGGAIVGSLFGGDAAAAVAALDQLDGSISQAAVSALFGG